MTTAREGLKDAALTGVGTLSREDFAGVRRPAAEIFTKHHAGWLGAVQGVAQKQESL